MSQDQPDLKKVMLPGDEEETEETLPSSEQGEGTDPNSDPSAEPGYGEDLPAIVEEGGAPATRNDETAPVAASGGSGGGSGLGDDEDPSAFGDEGDEGDGEEDEAQGRMSVLEHLQELRKALTRIVLAVLVGFFPCYAVAMKLFTILMQPMTDALTAVTEQKVVFTPEFFDALRETLGAALAEKGEAITSQVGPFVDAMQQSLTKVVLHQGQFIYTYPPEAFFAEVKVAIVASLFLVSPYIFYQIWSFIAPGLYQQERRWVIPIAMVSALFFVTGAAFGYFVVFPVGFEFFAQYSSDMISFTPKLSEYLSFSLKLLFAFGLAFELPVFIFFLSRLGIVTWQGLLKKGKYFVLVAFICGAILTPPDPVSQSLMAGPLILLYGLGIIIAFLFGKRKKPAPVEEPVEDPEEAPASDAAETQEEEQK